MSGKPFVFAAIGAIGVLSAFGSYQSAFAQGEPNLLSTKKELLPIVSSAGDRQQQADERIFAMNRAMRSNYARALKSVSSNINPVIVVQFDGVGGTFNLRDGNRSVRVQPVPKTYALAKSVAHVPLNIYVILAPYIDAPKDGLWQNELAASGKLVKDALNRLGESGLTGDQREGARLVLSESVKFIDKLLGKKDFTLDDYRAYADAIFPAVAKLRYFATSVQTRAVVALLKKWRDEIGTERWKDLSAVVIAPYTLSSETAVHQALRLVMDKDRVDRRLISIGGDQGNDIQIAINVLGRLYIDGLAARLVFPQGTPLGDEMTRSLSTSRDLMAVPAAKVLHEIIEEQGH